MLTHPTLDLLADLGLHGMAKGFRDLADKPEGATLGHAEWLGTLLERESTLRVVGHVHGTTNRRKFQQAFAGVGIVASPKKLDCGTLDIPYLGRGTENW